MQYKINFYAKYRRIKTGIEDNPDSFAVACIISYVIYKMLVG